MAAQPNDAWHVHDISVPDALKLGSPGGGASSSSSSSSSNSSASLELEISRLANLLRSVQEPVDITAVDYCSTRCRLSSSLHGGNLAAFLQEPRPAWSAVRWLLVDGVSGDVLQTLAKHYDLHPLGVEDVVQFQRIKAVAYPGHLYVAAHIWQVQKLRKAHRKQQVRQRQQAADRTAAAAATTHAAHAQIAAAGTDHTMQQQQQGQGQGVPTSASSRLWEWLMSSGPDSQEQQQQQQQHEQQQQDWRVDMLPAGGAAAAAGGQSSSWSDLDDRSSLCSSLDTSSGVSSVESSSSSPAARPGHPRMAAPQPQLQQPLLQQQQPQPQQELRRRRRRQQRKYESEDEESEVEWGRRRVGGGLAYADGPLAPWEAGDGQGAPHHHHHHAGRKREHHGHQQQQQQPHQGQDQQHQQHERHHQHRQHEQHYQQQHHDDRAASAPPGAQVAGGGVEEPGGTSPAAAAAGAAVTAAAVAAAAAAAAPGGPTAGGAAALAGPDPALAGPAAAAAADGAGRRPARPLDVQLVLPLQASGFEYRPTKSPFKRRRIMMQQVSMFLHASGVLITIFPGAAAAGGTVAQRVAGPVLQALRGMSSLLLESEDAGFLLQAMLRSCISTSLPVFSRLAGVVTRLDLDVLEGRLAMKLTWRLHVLRSTLAILARSFAPNQQLLETLMGLAAAESCVHVAFAPPRAASSPSSSASSAALQPQHAAQQPTGAAAGGGGGSAVGGGGGSAGAPGLAAAAAGGSTLHAWLDSGTAPAAAAAAAPGGSSSSARSGHSSGRSSSHSSGSGSSSSYGPVVISSLSRTYLEDLMDQALAVSADLSALSDHVGRLTDLVVSSLSHSNESANITLAVIGTIFLPLTFLAGIWGMNFEDMPELHWHYGYAFAYGMFVCVVLLALALMWYMGLLQIKKRVWQRILHIRRRPTRSTARKHKRR